MEVYNEHDYRRSLACAARGKKKLSQGEIEKRTDCFVAIFPASRRGHTVPAVETSEKFWLALEVPVYQLFYDGEEPPKVPSLLSRGKSFKQRVGQFRKEC